MTLFSRHFALIVLALLFAGLPGAARTAVWLAPGEPLGQMHLRALVEPALPPGEEFALSFSQPAVPLHNPASNDAFLQLLELRLDRRTERFSGSFLVRLESGEERVLGLAGQAQALVEVLVPVRSIGAGELLTADLLEPLVVAERQLRVDTITDPAALQDVEARRRLLPGRPVRQGDVQAPRLVRRGEAVEIVYRAPGIELVTMGRALEDGSRGNVVGVSNLDSDQRLAGVVTGARRITVGGPSGAAR
jgi:flagellar basal body P-ring formation protein FlgA